MYVPADSEPVTSITELGYKLPVGSATRRDRNAKASSAICTADEVRTPRINKPNTKIDMKNKSDNNTYAVITRESIFVEAPCETTYFKNLLDAERFMASYLARPREVEQCQLVKVMQWHEEDENCTEYDDAVRRVQSLRDRRPVHHF